MSDPYKSFSYSGSPWGSTTPPNPTGAPNLGAPFPGSPWGSTTPPNPNGQPNYSAPVPGSPWSSITPPNPTAPVPVNIPINIPIPSNPTHVLEGPRSSSFSHGSHSVIHSSIGGYPVPSHGS